MEGLGRSLQEFLVASGVAELRAGWACIALTAEIRDLIVHLLEGALGAARLSWLRGRVPWPRKG